MKINDATKCNKTIQPEDMKVGEIYRIDLYGAINEDTVLVLSKEIPEEIVDIIDEEAVDDYIDCIWVYSISDLEVYCIESKRFKSIIPLDSELTIRIKEENNYENN